MKKRKWKKPKTVQALAAMLRRNATRPELMLHGALEFALANYDAEYAFQHPIGRYVADFFIGAANLVIEADGGSHDTPWAIAHDCERTRFIESHGIRVIRFQNKEIENELVRVVDTILDECWDLPRAGTTKKDPRIIKPEIVQTEQGPVKVTICPPGSAVGKKKKAHKEKIDPVSLRPVRSIAPALKPPKVTGWHVAQK